MNDDESKENENDEARKYQKEFKVPTYFDLDAQYPQGDFEPKIPDIGTPWNEDESQEQDFPFWLGCLPLVGVIVAVIIGLVAIRLSCVVNETKQIEVINDPAPPSESRAIIPRNQASVPYPENVGTMKVYGQRAKPDGSRQRWLTPATEVVLETEHGWVTLFWSEGRLYVHSGNMHELVPHWHGANMISHEFVED